MVLWSDVGAAVYPTVILRHVGADPLELAAVITSMKNFCLTPPVYLSFIQFSCCHENPSGGSVSIMNKNKINL